MSRSMSVSIQRGFLVTMFTDTDIEPEAFDKVVDLNSNTVLTEEIMTDEDDDDLEDDLEAEEEDELDDEDADQDFLDDEEEEEDEDDYDFDDEE